MELLQLKYFLTIGRLKHMTRAAETLHVSQSTLSHAIKRLESELGVELFEHVGRGLALTAYGEDFLERTRRIFHELDQAQVQIDDMQGRNSKCIRLASSVPGVAVPLIKDYHLRNPDIVFDLRFLSNPDILSLLNKGSVDLAFTDIKADSPDVQKNIIWQDQLYILLPENHPLSESGTISLSQIADQRFISSVAETGLREIIQEYSAQTGYTFNISMEVESYKEALYLVSTGMGVTLSSRFALESALIDSLHNDKSLLDFIKPVLIDKPECTWEIAMVNSSKQYLPEHVKQFRRFVFDYFETRSEAAIFRAINHREDG